MVFIRVRAQMREPAKKSSFLRENNVKSKINMHTSHKTYLFGGPLEAGNDGILDFVQVLDSLSTINQDVGSKGVGTEAPDLTGFSDIVFVFVGQVTTSDLEILLVGNVTLKKSKIS